MSPRGLRAALQLAAVMLVIYALIFRPLRAALQLAAVMLAIYALIFRALFC